MRGMGGGGGGGGAGYQPMSTAVYFGDLTPYLTFGAFLMGRVLI
jgi:hypothetical protein